MVTCLHLNYSYDTFCFKFPVDAQTLHAAVTSISVNRFYVRQLCCHLSFI